LLILVLLDWKIWAPQRDTARAEFLRWLAVDVLGNSAAPAQDWRELRGTFRGCDISIERASVNGLNGLRWSASSAADLDLRVVRTEHDAQPQPQATAPADPAAPAAFDTGDPEFEARYQWQTHAPGRVLPLLKEARVRRPGS
jgi:hypothetical protein